jgi:hypothetical protein
VSWDITSYLTAGDNTLQVTNSGTADCLSLIVATVSVDAVVLDTTAPVLGVTITSGSMAFTPAPGTWANQPVVVTFSCTDETELATGIEPSVTTTLSTDGQNLSVASPPCEDAAGNVATPQTVTNINIDQTGPVFVPIDDLTLTPTSPNGAPVIFIPAVTDALSSAGGLTATCVDQTSAPFTSGQIAPVGTTTITCTATDLAGNTSIESFVVNVGDPSDLLAKLRADTITRVTNPAAERALVATLDQVRQHYTRGNPLGVYFSMLTYVVQMERYADARAVSPAGARQLLLDARVVLDSLT